MDGVPSRAQPPRIGRGLRAPDRDGRSVEKQAVADVAAMMRADTAAADRYE